MQQPLTCLIDAARPLSRNPCKPRRVFTPGMLTKLLGIVVLPAMRPQEAAVGFSMGRIIEGLESTAQPLFAKP